MKIIIQNIATEYRDEGQGRVMVMLHGWQDNLRTFDAIVPLLSNSWRIVRVDLPGFGGTELADPSWYLDDYVGFVRSFVEKLGVKPDILVGHSFGGRIIIKGSSSGMLAAEKIVLIASAGVAKKRTLRSLAYKGAAKIGNAITRIPPLSARRQQLRQKLYKRTSGDYLHAGPMREIFLHSIREDLSDAAKHINVPALLIWGDRDTQTPLQDGERLASYIPNSELKVIPGAGHFAHQEKPEEAARIIRNFLSV